MQAATRMLPEILVGFKKQYPSVKLIITKQNDNRLSSESDFCIYSSRTKINKTNHITLLKENCMIGLSIHHPLASQEHVDLADLYHDDFIILQNNWSLSNMTKEYCMEAGFNPNITLECDDQSAVFSLIENNLGVAFIPEKTWNIDHHPGIILKPIRNKKCIRYINLIQKE